MISIGKDEGHPRKKNLEKSSEKIWRIRNDVYLCSPVLKGTLGKEKTIFENIGKYQTNEKLV
jgi:hypothetical protein